MTTVREAPALVSPSRLAPLRERDFRWVLFVQLASSIRQPMQFFAQGWFVNQAAPDDRRVVMLGLLATLQGAAYLSWVLFGSALSDRYPRRLTLMVTHAAGFAWLVGTSLLLRFPGAAEGEGLWLWIMMAVFIEFGVMMAQDIPSRAAFAGEVVPQDVRTSAITMHWLVFASALVVGAPLTGWMIERIGFANLYLVAASMHLVVLFGLRMIRARGGAADPEASADSVIDNVRAGLRYLGEDPAMRWTVVLTILALAMGILTMGILVAAWVSDVLLLDAQGWGRLALFWGLGGVLANLVLMMRGDYRGKGLIFLTGAGLLGVAVLGVSASRHVVPSAVGFAFAGVGAQVVMTVGNAIAQSIVPGRLLGRVMGLLWVAQGLAQSAGLFVGLIGQAIGLTVLYPLVGVLMVAVTMVTFFRSPLRSLP
ncbi:MAG: MFS transporter [Dehalococcoidia bacterium]